jgi:uncharacterized repeat protein (TIGR02543 family)
LLTAVGSPAIGGSVNNGSAAAGGYYNSGSAVTLSAVANDGFQFTGWSGDLAGAASPRVITMDAPHTVTANFTSASARGPSVMGMEPAWGTGARQSFTLRFSHPSGYQNLSVVNMLINSSLDGRRGCYLAYVVATKTLVLVDDAGAAAGPYAGAVAAGSPGAIQNSQCAVSLTSATGAGTTLTLVLDVTFQSGFSGNRIQFLAARDAAGNNSDWQPMGVWCSGSIPGGVIAVGGATPERASIAPGASQTVTLNLTNNKGANNFGVVNLLVNRSLDGRRACYLAYVATSNTLFLVDDAGDAAGPYAGGIMLNGTTAKIENGQCSISGTGSSAVAAGNGLTLRLNMMFQPGFAGNRILYVAGRDIADGNNTDWQAVGSWTVQ